MSESGTIGQATSDGAGLFRSGRFAEALPLLQQRVSDNPLDASARAYLAACYAQTGDAASAVTEFERLTNLEPGNAQHLTNLGVAYEKVGNLRGARDAYERAIAANPAYAKAKERLAAANSRLGAGARPSNADAGQGIGLRPLGAPAGAGMSAPQARQQPQTPLPSTTRYQAPPTVQSYSSGGLNWGAFFLSFFWSLAHRAWLCAVVSFFLPLIGAIWLLLKGNDIAWENRVFKSEDDFHSVQRAWAIWGVSLWALNIVLGLALGVVDSKRNAMDSLNGANGGMNISAPSGGTLQVTPGVTPQ